MPITSRWSISPTACSSSRATPPPASPAGCSRSPESDRGAARPRGAGDRGRPAARPGVRGGPRGAGDGGGAALQRVGGRGDVAARRDPGRRRARGMLCRRPDRWRRRACAAGHGRRRHGGLDVLVNSAAVMHRIAFDETTVEQYDAILDLNLRSLFFVTQGAAPALRRARGKVVNIADLGGLEPWPSYPA